MDWIESTEVKYDIIEGASTGKVICPYLFNPFIQWIHSRDSLSINETMTRPVQQEEENLGYNYYIDAGIELNV